MLIWELWMVAISAIRANKLRSFLTMLGIIIGVGAVITMIALGSGAQKAVQDNISALGTNLLTLMPGQQFMRGVASDQRVGMTVDDATEIQNTARHLVAVMPEINRSFQVKYRNLNANIQVTGTTPSYFKARSYVVTAGRVFTAGDDEARRRVAVIGSAVGDDFGQNGAGMIGQTVEIRGITFEIIGLLGSKGAQQGWMNPDEQLFIPLSTARYRLMGTDRVRTITVKVDDERNMSVAMISLEQAMRRRHRIQPSAPNDFQIRNQADLAQTLNQTTQTFSALLAGIAAVSLLVGGIGIMNIMLVSVTERTREIGIRLSIGARGREVLFQFLVEAMSLSGIGGVVGILLGLLVSFFAARLLSATCPTCVERTPRR